MIRSKQLLTLSSIMFQKLFVSQIKVIKFQFARKTNTVIISNDNKNQVKQGREIFDKINNKDSSKNVKQTILNKADFNVQNSKILYNFQNLEQDFKTYQNFLQIHNKHQKKAHIKIAINQLKLIQKAIQEDRQELILTFLQKNKTNRIANEISMQLIIKYFQSKWSKMSQEKRAKATAELINHGQFQLFQNYLPPQLRNKKLQKLTPIDRKSKLQAFILSRLNSQIKYSQKIQFFYNSLLYFKKLPQSLLKIQSLLQEDPSIQKHKLYFLRQYLNNEKLQPNFQSKSTNISIIEQNVLCLLKALNYKFKTQVNIGRYNVDFLLQNSTTQTQPQTVKKGKSEPVLQTVLQVFGSHHFTTRNKLRPTDIKKIILLQKYYKVRVINHQSFSKTVGFTNKRALLKKIIQQDKDVTWEPQNQGYNSNWQLESEYLQFK